MPDFQIDVTRTSYSSKTFIVTGAKNVTEATERAIAAAGDYDFGSGNAEYDSDFACPLPKEVSKLKQTTYTTIKA